VNRRVVIVLVIGVVAAVAARVAAPAPQRPVRFSAALACGVERWTIKTLQDRPKLYVPQHTTVANLVSIPHPSSVPSNARLPIERHRYWVYAAVTLVRRESDQDLHLVLKAAGANSHMIAEAPLVPSCTTNATATRKQQMATARAAVRVCSRARVEGVAFWDYFHHQTGVAPNVIELHPILGFACLSG
jgi:hypothetical protein